MWASTLPWSTEFELGLAHLCNYVIYVKLCNFGHAVIHALREIILSHAKWE